MKQRQHSKRKTQIKPATQEKIITRKTTVRLKNYPNLHFVVFTARRYAKRSMCRRRVSVCLSVCHIPALYQNG